MFDGFPRELPRFLGQLEKHNDRDWFEENRATYERAWLEPAKAFVVAMDDTMRRISPDINVEPRINATIRRINRDVRFSKDKRPYKPHLDFFFRYAGSSKEGPGYFLRIRPKDVIMGSGTWYFDRDQLLSFREAVDADTSGKALATIVARLERAGYGVGIEHYKRVPRGHDADHPRARLLKFAGLHTHVEMKTPKEMFSRTFVKTCAMHFKKTATLAEWVRDNVSGGKR